MKKILIMGAGSAQSNGVVNCLIDGIGNNEEIIAAGSEPTDLIFCKAKKKYLIPHCRSANYKEKLLKLLLKEKPDLIHFQHDEELMTISSFRNEILNTGTKLYIPDHQDINTCVYKYKSYLKFKEAGIKVPNNIMINDENDLRKSFRDLKNKSGEIWIRSTSIGGGGKGSLNTDNFDFAKYWIDKYKGWGNFAAAEMLSPDSVTFLTIWHKGELIVGQGRSRQGWSGRSVSGVTGVTKVGLTHSDPKVVETAIESVKAISKNPHGIYGVDMTYDSNKIPNPTEINIGRFFTTVQFFKEAGLNMPEIMKNIVLYNKFPKLKESINPLPDELLWLRAMDEKPKLTSKEEIMNQVVEL
jgi:carbamoyl-phosphate synthase large subunit